jgi:hypothetical protein
MLPHWSDLYNKINMEGHSNFTPHNNPDVKVLDDQVFPNIRRSSLHRVACWTPIFPCIETIGCISDDAKMAKFTIKNEESECVVIFLPMEVKKYYKLRDPEERLNTNFVVKFYELHETSWLVASWWKEDKNFTNRNNGWYKMVKLTDPYIYLMALINLLYREKDYSKFSEAWMPLAYTVAISRNSFNWGAII